jgi:tetratricopeptide (TPR) repeat protein
MNNLTTALLLALVIVQPGCASLKSKAFPKLSRRNLEAHERSLSMARLMERHGKYDQALKIYQQVIEEDANNIVANHRMGILAVRRGEHQLALEHFEKAAKRDEPSAELLSDIGYTKYLTHDLEEAEKTLRAALKANPQLNVARTNLGLVLAEQSRDDEALVEFRKGTSEANALSNLAYIQTKLGRLAEAERNYHLALELDPKQRTAAEALVQFQGVRDKADAMVARLDQKADRSSTEEPVTIVQVAAESSRSSNRTGVKNASWVDEGEADLVKEVKVMPSSSNKINKINPKNERPQTKASRPVEVDWTNQTESKVEQPVEKIRPLISPSNASLQAAAKPVASTSSEPATAQGQSDVKDLTPSPAPIDSGWSEPAAGSEPVFVPRSPKSAKGLWWNRSTKQSK